MQKFGQETPTQQKVPDFATRQLRAALILEEAFETCDALGMKIIMDHRTLLDNAVIKTPDLVGVLDGLCDLDYVARCGTALACGISEETLKLAQDEVHRSNMSKLWHEDEIEAAKRDHPHAVIEDYGGGLYRLKVGGKTIKSPSYSPANLSQFVK